MSVSTVHCERSEYWYPALDYTQLCVECDLVVRMCHCYSISLSLTLSLSLSLSLYLYLSLSLSLSVPTLFPVLALIFILSRLQTLIKSLWLVAARLEQAGAVVEC